MPISEHVRLIIEIVNAPQGARSMRSLESHAQSMRNAFISGRTTIAQFQQSVQTDLGNLEKFVKQSSTRFQQSASGLVLPASLAEQTEQTAERINKAVESTTRGTRQLTRAQSADSEVRKRGNLLLIDFSRIAQDSVFGIRAMVNNMDPLILNTQRYTDAVAAANGGTAGFTATMKGLRAVLSGPGGLLVLINILFLLGSLTDVFDPIVKQFNSIKDAILGTTDAAKELQKELEKTTDRGLKLREGIDITASIDSWRNLNNQIRELEGQNAEAMAKRIFNAFGSLGASELDGTSRALQRENKRIAAEIKDLQALQETHKEAVREFRLLELSLISADPNAISRIEQEAINRAKEFSVDILEIRKRDGQQQLQLEGDIARERVNVRAHHLEIEKRNILAFRFNLYSTLIAQERALSKALTEEERTRIQASIDNIKRFQAELAQQAQIINLVIAGAKAQADENQRIAEAAAARDARRRAQDLASELREIQLRNTFEGVDERIGLLEHETEQNKIQLERQLEDWETQYGANGKLRNLTRQFVEQIDKEFIDKKEKILIEDEAKTRAHSEALIRIQEQLALAYGASTEAILSAQLARAQAELDLIPEEDIEKRRQQIESIKRLEAELATFRASMSARERDRVEEELFFRRELEEATRASQSRIQQILQVGKRSEFQILQERKDALIRFIEDSKAEADRYAEVFAEIKRVQEELAVVPLGTQRYFELRGELASLETQMKLVEQAQERYRDGQIDLLQLNEEIARLEDRIWKERENNIERWLNSTISAVRQAFSAQRRFTDLDVEYQRHQFQQRERDLHESLAKQEISNREHHFELRKLAQDRAEFEKDVEEDRKSVLVSLSENLTDAIIKEGQRRLAAFIAEQVIRIAISKAAIKTTEAAVTSSMATITASAAPAAAATSIATAGGSAVAGAAAAIAAIGAIIAALAAIKGFDKGGYTGDDRPDRVAGLVHGGEFVLTQRAVRGNKKPFYALMRALERGLDPNELMQFLQAKGWDTRINPFIVGGFGYQSGGFAAGAASLNLPEELSSHNRGATLRSDAGVDALRSELRGLRSEIRALAEAPRPVVVSRRTQADLVRGGADYIEGKRTINPHIQRR